MINRRNILIVMTVIALLGLGLDRYTGIRTKDVIKTLSINQPQTVFPPISNWESRITLKPFGIYVTPDNSPVDPEIFTGYHTGTDFEILLNEEDAEIDVFAICDGEITSKRNVSGYGGVLTQNCVINDQKVEIVYGHLKLNSIDFNTGFRLIRGDKIGILGQGYTLETSGERKHLHLGITKTKGDLRGYVSNKEELSNWLNIEDILK